MTYTVDSTNWKVTTVLLHVDSAGRYNVPLAKAILRNVPCIDVRAREKNLWVHLRWDAAATATFSVGTMAELTDGGLITAVHDRAQDWLSCEMSRLRSLQDSLDTLSVAFPKEVQP